MAHEDQTPKPPRPGKTFDPLNIAGSRKVSDWPDLANAANEVAGPAALLGVGIAKLAGFFRRWLEDVILGIPPRMASQSGQSWRSNRRSDVPDGRSGRALSVCS